MAQEEQRDDLRSSILEAIRANVRELSSVASRLEDADVDMYGKNTPGDGYAKNTQVTVLERSFEPARLIEGADPGNERGN